VKNLTAARYLKDRVTSLNGFEPVYGGSFFNEFAVRTPVSPEVINRRLAKSGFMGGLDLGRFYDGLESAILLCATEIHSKKSMDSFLEVLREFER